MCVNYNKEMQDFCLKHNHLFFRFLLINSCSEKEDSPNISGISKDIKFSITSATHINFDQTCHYLLFTSDINSRWILYTIDNQPDGMVIFSSYSFKFIL